MLRFLLSALVLGVCVTAAQAEDLPQTVAQWRQAAWTRLAQLSNIPPEVVDKPGTYQAEVTIVVRRDGSVARSELAQSCGKDELDENALRLAHMASPLPPLPPDMPFATMSVTLPVVYAYPPRPPRTVRELRRLRKDISR